MNTADFLVIGGGIAGLSAAAALAPHGRVIVLEAESALGYHASGRSVTFSHYGIGNPAVRALTKVSNDLFRAPRDGPPLAKPASALFFATEAMLGDLAALAAEMAPFTDALRHVGPDDIQRLFPLLRVGPGGAVAGIVQPDGLKLDADALLQYYARIVRAEGGTVRTDSRIAAIRRDGAAWEVATEAGDRFAAPILVNAAGAWADAVAGMAGVAPLGLQPMRRTIVVVDPPPGVDVAGWPFLKTAPDLFYLMPEAGRLLASPVDAIRSDPCDARPEDYDIALTAARIEEYTTLTVRRIAHSWAGLRTFTPDAVPSAGFAADADGFFWLAGQGGYGFQTAPAMAAITQALVTGGDWPARLAAEGVTAAMVSPSR